jgi:sortase (surface protein transpeptidase)
MRWAGWAPAGSALVLSLAAGCSAAAPSVAGSSRSSSPAGRSSPAEPAGVPLTTPSDGGVRQAADLSQGLLPARVRIPAIRVDAPVVQLGLQAGGALEITDGNDEVGWWKGGARPGATGPAVIGGHVDSWQGPAVFFRLRQLNRGDRVELADQEGRTVTFVVEKVEQHPKDAFPTDRVYGYTPDPTLRLLTCGGAFDRARRSHRDNIVVYASLAG